MYARWVSQLESSLDVALTAAAARESRYAATTPSAHAQHAKVFARASVEPRRCRPPRRRLGRGGGRQTVAD
jgi:hypothetical protein